jgi:hypothetical protein
MTPSSINQINQIRLTHYRISQTGVQNFTSKTSHVIQAMLMEQTQETKVQKEMTHPLHLLQVC